MTRRFLSLIVVGLLASAQAFAQMHFSASLNNNHLWRGAEVSDGLVLEADASVTFADGHLNVGLWGGTNTSGNYKEFDYHASFTAKGFTLAVWDIFNFSPGASYDNQDFFNYNAHTTGRFLDVTASYNFATVSPKVPLTLSWSTVVFGRDRVKYLSDPATTDDHNIYSTWIYGEYRVWQNKDWAVDAGLGLNFALNNASGTHKNFFGDHYGINTVNLKVTRQVRLGKWHFPVYANALFNPQARKGYYQIGATLLSF